jgi:hypothetical protein
MSNDSKLNKLNSIRAEIVNANASKRLSEDFPRPQMPEDNVGNAKLSQMTKDLGALVKTSESLLADGKIEPKSVSKRMISFMMATIKFLLKYMVYVALAAAVYYGGVGYMTTKYWSMVGSIGKFNARVASYIAESFTTLLGTIALGYVWQKLDFSIYATVYYPCFSVCWIFMSMYKGMGATIKHVARVKYGMEIPEKLKPPNKSNSPKPSTAVELAEKQANKITGVVVGALSFVFRMDFLSRGMKVASWMWSGYGWYNKWRPKQMTPKEAEEAYEEITTPRNNSNSPRKTPKRNTPTGKTPKRNTSTGKTPKRNTPTGKTPKRTTPTGKTPKRPNAQTSHWNPPPPDVPNATKPYISTYPSYDPRPLG